MHDKAKKVDNKTQELKQSLQREPSAEEIAYELQLSVKEVEESVRNSLVANLLSIEEKRDDDYKEGIDYANLHDDSIQPDHVMIESELRQELIESIQSLNQNEQMVISLFYHEELTLTEIGHVLELITSRISHIHRKSIFKL